MTLALTIDLLVVLPALATALALKPWRAVAAAGPPWPWLAWWAVLPLLWGADHYARMPIVQPLSGAALLVLCAGWPLAMLALLPTAVLTTLLAGLDFAEGLHRLAWLGVAPGTLALAGGLALRRWLPRHLFIYILGRGFFVTGLAATLSGALALAVTGTLAGTSDADLLLARGLAASGEAFITGMLTAIFVAFRPQWLATYTDRMYLPRD